MAWSQSAASWRWWAVDVLVIVPRLTGPAPHLDETHAALEQPAGDQKLPGLSARAIEVADESAAPG